MKKIIIILIIATSMLFNSCQKDYLRLNSPTDVDSSVALGTIGNLELSMLGVYKSFGWWDPTTDANGFRYFGYSFYSIYNDLIAGNMIQVVAHAYGIMSEEYNFKDHINNNLSSYIFINNWEFYYDMILRANSIIISAKVLQVSDVDKPRLNDVIGQALTFRALMYHSLNLHYAAKYNEATATTDLSVPISKNIAVEAIARSSTRAVLDFVLSDLDEAIVAFGNAPKNTKASVLGIEAAKLLKARVYMYTHKYAEALVVAKDILATTSKKIMGTTEYYKGFTSLANPEWIFGTAINSDSGKSWDSFMSYVSCQYPGGPSSWSPRGLDMSYMFGMSQDDVNPEVESYVGGDIPDTRGLTMRESDTRRDIFITDSPAQIAANRKTNPAYYFDKGYVAQANVAAYQGMSKKYIHKFPGVANGAGDVVAMRLAEVYYIAAEAASLTGDDGLARTYLAATVTPYDSGFTTTESKERLRTLISNYKAVDMWCEGRRLEDVKRRGEWIYRLAKYNSQRIPVAGQFKSVSPYNAVGGSVILDYTTMPIPEQALNNNPLL